MTYKLMPTSVFVPMSTEDLQALQYKVNKWLTVKFPESDKLFVYKGHSCSEYGYNKTPLSDRDTCLLVLTTVKELLVELTHRTYQLRQLQDDADYELALAVFEQYFTSAPDSEESRFAYLLSLIIGDYESQHYPIALSSTVDFIDHMLEENARSWATIRACLGYGDYVNLDFVKSLFEPENMKVEHIIKLSHFFHLPVQAFIVGGYDAQP